MSDDSTRWLVIKAGARRERREVEAYLYDHTTIVATFSEGYGDVYIAVTVDARENPAAPYLAQYQADRLASGMIRAEVAETLPEARAVALAELALLVELA